MEGPTPVSALIHAATLVTAGLYLLIRSSHLLEYSPTSLLIITLIGATTAFFAASCGLVQNDLKRIIAFSTISQLGYFPILIITFLSFCLWTADLDTFFFNNKLNYTINSISILSSFAFFSTENLYSKYPKVESLKKIRDNFSSTISYVDKYNDFSSAPQGRRIIRQKYKKIPGIYLWSNNINNKCYVGKSVNLYLRLSKYLSTKYINDNKTKMAICGSLSKYGTNNFTFYILETFDKDTVSQKFLSERENY